MNRLLIVLLALFYGALVAAQSTSECSRALKEAEQSFEQGRLLYLLDASANKKFYDCLASGSFSINEEIRARKLLVKVQLFSDNEAKAEEALVDLLHTDKEHQLTPEDPAELYFLYSKFRTEPIVRASAKFGVNRSLITVLQTFNTSQIEKGYNQELSNGVSFWGELLAERHIFKGFEVAGGAQLRLTSYEVEGVLIEEGLLYEVNHESIFFRAPLLFRYNLWYDAKKADNSRKKLIPYVFAGGSYDLIINSRYEDTSRSGGIAVTLADENASLTRNEQVAMQNASIFGGLGVKLRVGRAKVNFLTFEARYDNSLFNHINPENRWLNQNVGFEITHVEDDLTINTVSFSIGYVHSFYLPKIRKEYR